MIIKHICPHCYNKLFLDKEEIMPLTEESKKMLAEEEEKLEKMKTEYKTTLFGKKIRKYSDIFIDEIRRTPLGEVKCFCGETSFILKN